jgi:hypothetical protein
MRSMRKLLASMFFTSASIGFAIDLLLLNYQPLGRGLFWPLLSGTLGTASVAVRVKRIGLLLVLLPIAVASYWLGVRVAHSSPALPDPAALKYRVVFDAIGILAGIFIGYRWLVAFIGTEDELDYTKASVLRRLANLVTLNRQPYHGVLPSAARYRQHHERMSNATIVLRGRVRVATFDGTARVRTSRIRLRVRRTQARYGIRYGERIQMDESARMAIRGPKG